MPVTDAQGNKTYQYQQAAARLYGLEAGLNLHPEWLKGFSCNNSIAVIYGYNKKDAYRHKRVNGEFLPLIPPLKLVSSLNQAVPVKSGVFGAVNLKVEADYNAPQNRYLALNESETATGGYTLFNVAVHTQVRYAGSNVIQVQLQASNVFDKACQSNLSRLKYFEYDPTASKNSGIYNMGRNICVKTILSF